MVEHETQKLKELDEEHSQELKEWREKLRPRKKVILKTLIKMFASVHPPTQPSSQLLALYLMSIRCRRYRGEETKSLSPKGSKFGDKQLQVTIINLPKELSS